MEMRLKEHKYPNKNNNTKNGIAVRAWGNDHHVNWNDVKIVAVEHHLTKRKVMESLRIRKKKNTSNLDNGYTLSPIWRPLMS